MDDNIKTIMNHVAVKESKEKYKNGRLTVPVDDIELSKRLLSPYRTHSIKRPSMKMSCMESPHDRQEGYNADSEK